jgi:riboflavin synthase alpha subunit
VFTGIVDRTGEVVAVAPAGERTVLRVALGPLADRARAGDSVAVAGVCLTLAAPPEGGTGTFEAVRETLERTTLGGLRAGSRVNLEPALRAGDPLGGHFVQGHVDGVGVVRANGGPEGDWTLSVEAPPEVLPYLLRKGSVAVDGVSLTVAAVDGAGFAAALVPHTLDRTTLRALRPGDRVNLEADLLGKWVRRLLEERGALPPSKVTRELLAEEGFG